MVHGTFDTNTSNTFLPAAAAVAAMFSPCEWSWRWPRPRDQKKKNYSINLHSLET